MGFNKNDEERNENRITESESFSVPETEEEKAAETVNAEQTADMSDNTEKADSSFTQPAPEEHDTEKPGGGFMSADPSLRESGQDRGGDHGGYNSYSYNYGAPQPPKKKSSSGAVFAVCAALVGLILIISAFFAGSASGSNGKANKTDSPKTTDSEAQGNRNSSPTGETTEKSQTQTKEKKSGTVVYSTDANWINDGTLVSDEAIVNATYHVIDSVVAITTETVKYSSYYGGTYVSTGAGSGVIIADETIDGETSTLILTNAHVISGARQVKVTLSNGKEHDAEVLGSDELSDIAVVRINASGLTKAKFGDSKELKLGQTVIAIGNPLGQLAGTVTAGIISCLEREVNMEGTMMTLIQTDTAINPGNSGGGLFNLNGELVGITNGGYSADVADNIGFAVPSNLAKSMASDIISYGYITGRSMMGVYGFIVNSSNYSQYQDTEKYGNLYKDYIYGYYQCNRQLLEGFYISESDKVKYADDTENRFEYGDVIAEIEGTKVSDGNAISSALLDYNPGDTVTVTVYRLTTAKTGTIFGERETKKIVSADIRVVLQESQGNSTGE